MAASMQRVCLQLSNTKFKFKPLYLLSIGRRCVHDKANTDEDVKYPEVVSKYPPGKWNKEIGHRQAWRFYEKGQDLLKIQDVKTRLESISGDKDRRMFLTESWDHMPRTLEYKQFITRSFINQGLPEIYNSINVDETHEKLKPFFQNILLQENEYQYKYAVEHNKIYHTKVPKFLRSRLIGSIMSFIHSACSSENHHLLCAQMDRDVRVETFWYLAGYQDKSVPMMDKTGRLWFQYKGDATYQMRTESPLPEFVSRDDKLSTQEDALKFNYGPNTRGQVFTYDKPITVSGHWVGDPCEFTSLGCHALDDKYDEFVQNYAEKPELLSEALVQCGLIKSFASCMAQAHNQGFNVYHDVTYPFTTQTLLTDGHFVQFFAYQLNTMHLWLDRESNPYNNILWVGHKHELFDTIENGQVKGYNDQAFMDLLKFVLLEPVDRGCDLRPYLSEEDRPSNKNLYINHIGDPPLEHKKIERWQYPRKPVYTYF